MNALTKINPSAPTLSPRRARAIGRETFTQLMTIELSGDPGYGSHFDCEVEFYESAKAWAPTHDDPGSPAEYEIASIRPIEFAIDPTTGRPGTRLNYRDCPPWLAEILIDCVDSSRLEAIR